MGATPWDGEVLAAELDDQRGPRAFVHEPGGFEPILQQQGGETFLCVNDHLGMPKDLVSGDGLVKGKKGEPSEQITTITNDDKLKTFDHHKNGHTFEDTNEYELPHYHGPSGEHISYGNPADYEQ